MTPVEVSVQVRGHSYLNHHLPEERQHGFSELVVLEGSTVEDVCMQLGLPRDEIVLVTINQGRVPWDMPVRQGDYVEFFPRVGGG